MPHHCAPLAEAGTRERMLRATGTLLRARGYHGVGLREIIEAAGAPRGSIYFHFPRGKEELACAAIARSGERHAALLEAALEAAPSLAVGFAAVSAVLADEAERSSFARGCPVATVALETVEGPESVRGACVAFLERLEGVLARRIAREHEALTGEAAQRAARRALAYLEGALLLARTRRDAAALRDAGPAMLALVEAVGG